MNAFADASPVPQGDGARAAMGFTLTTGDSADNVQLNEVQWVVRLLEGGSLNPNSGVDDVACAARGAPPGEAANYTGVQDYDDYPPGNTEYYDPDDPQASWSTWPQYPGLLDRAQQTFTATGLKVKSYVTLRQPRRPGAGQPGGARSLRDARHRVQPKPTAGSAAWAARPRA